MPHPINLVNLKVTRKASDLLIRLVTKAKKKTVAGVRGKTKNRNSFDAPHFHPFDGINFDIKRQLGKSPNAEIISALGTIFYLRRAITHTETSQNFLRNTVFFFVLW